MQVAGTFAGFAGHLGTEALNASYYMEEFDSFLHKLKDPVAVRLPPSLLAVHAARALRALGSCCLFSLDARLLPLMRHEVDGSVYIASSGKGQ